MLARIDSYLRRSRMAPSRLGREAVGDPRLVSDLRGGRVMQSRTAKRVAAWLDQAERELDR